MSDIFLNSNAFDLKNILQQENSEIVLSAILNETPDIIYVADLETRSIVYINRRVEEIMGVSEEEIYKKGFDVFPDLVHPDDYLKRMEQLTQVANTNNNETVEIEIRMKVPDEGYHWFYVRERVFKRGDAGRPEQVVGICTNINQQKLAEHESKKLSRQVFKTNQELKSLNEELETFNRVATREFLETLQTMYTCLEYIASHDAENFSNTGKANIRKAQGYVQRMRLVAHDITAFLQLGVFINNTTWVELDKVINKALFGLQKQFPQVESSVQLARLPVIKSNPVLLGLLFQNLLENSIKFRKEDKGLVIKIDYARADEINFHPLSLKDTTYHIISVRDNGIGFDQQDAEKIFSFFSRLHDKTRYRGSGIGLAVCKKIMQMHSGFIEAESSPGEGTTLTCYFPEEAENNME